ncbi:hypothetical protein QNH28_16920 [Paenibacillus sp. G2S3]|nr:hypothetical protein [Paenibacillus sp. G2S3]WHY17191.1 hypothetical protein QNH28_16920 [Paenibacillus sp. G2S3]
MFTRTAKPRLDGTQETLLRVMHPLLPKIYGLPWLDRTQETLFR